MEEDKGQFVEVRQQHGGRVYWLKLVGSSFSTDDARTITTTVPRVSAAASAVSPFKVERSVPAVGRAAHAAPGQMHEHVHAMQTFWFTNSLLLFSFGPDN